MVDEYKMLPGETERQYIFRVCQDKDLIGSWSDVATVINKTLGHEFASSTYRKQYKNFCDMYAELKNTLPQNTDEEIADIEAATERLKLERYKLSETKRQLDRDLRHKARLELFYENIGDAIHRFDHDMLVCVDADNCLNQNKEYLLTIADVHMGACFKSVANEYSSDICRARMSSLLSDTIKFVNDRNITHINVVSLGDDIAGILRTRDLSLSDSAVVDAVIGFSRLMAEFLNKLSCYVRVTYYHVCYSNHSQTRPLGTPANQLAVEDLEKIIFAYIKDMLADNNDVQVIGDPMCDHIDAVIAEKSICFLHGHQIKNIESAVKDLSVLYDTQYDYVIMGHHHAAKILTVGERDSYNVEVIVAPAIVGSDVYSDSLMKGAKSGASIYEFDQLFGRTDQHMIILN